jgi:hypothetical protein
MVLLALLWLAGCASIPPPPQPQAAAPHALLQLPDTIHVLAIDKQTVDSRAQIRELRLTPGDHTLYLAYEAVGVGDSPQHSGQQAAPFPLMAQAGMTYVFEAKT